MKFVIITGPQAVGKMTVGQALEARTGLKLFHNHMTIDLVTRFFDYGSDEARHLIGLYRSEMFKAMAGSGQAGFIFTYVWAFDLASEHAFVEEVTGMFAAEGAEIYVVELEADLATRIARNGTENRLRHKAPKRDVAASEALLIRSEGEYRMNSEPGELAFENYLRIDNTTLSADEVAQQIAERFSL